LAADATASPATTEGDHGYWWQAVLPGGRSAPGKQVRAAV